MPSKKKTAPVNNTYDRFLNALLYKKRFVEKLEQSLAYSPSIDEDDDQSSVKITTLINHYIAIRIVITYDTDDDSDIESSSIATIHQTDENTTIYVLLSPETKHHPFIELLSVDRSEAPIGQLPDMIYDKACELIRELPDITKISACYRHSYKMAVKNGYCSSCVSDFTQIEDPCPICKDDAEPSHFSHPMGCFHIFHTHCLSCVSPKICPCCRIPYTNISKV